MEIPTFGSEHEEREFWVTHDSVDFLAGAEQVTLEHIERSEFTSSAEHRFYHRRWEI